MLINFRPFFFTQLNYFHYQNLFLSLQNLFLRELFPIFIKLLILNFNYLNCKSKHLSMNLKRNHLKMINHLIYQYLLAISLERYKVCYLQIV